MYSSDKILNKMKEYAKTHHIPIIRADTQKFLKQILIEHEPANILEIGTAIGYSAITIAQTLLGSCMIDTIEKDYDKVIRALDFIKETDYGSVINVIFGEAKDVLANLNKKYDFIFFDGAKNQYYDYLKLAMKLLNDDAVIVADNIYYKGMVRDVSYDKRKNRTIVRSLRRYIKIISESRCFATTLVDIDDGISVSVYKGGVLFE